MVKRYQVYKDYLEGFDSCNVPAEYPTIVLASDYDALRALTDRAIAVLNRWIEPDGITAEQAMREMTAILDGPEQRRAYGEEG